MELLSVRKGFSNLTTISQLYIDQIPGPASYILEPTTRVGADPRGIIAIPEGRYEVTMYNSPKNGRRVPILGNVPGRTYIEMHIGNFYTDTDGCLLFGTTMGNDCVLESETAFNLIVPQIDTALTSGSVYITIKNAGA